MYLPTGDFAHVCSMSKDMSGCASTVYVVTSNLASGSAEPSALSVVVNYHVVRAHIVKRRGYAHEQGQRMSFTSIRQPHSDRLSRGCAKVSLDPPSRCVIVPRVLAFAHPPPILCSSLGYARRWTGGEYR